MLVLNILRQKGNRVVTTRAAVPLLEAARILRKEKIGAMVVLDAGNELVGILSERDIVQALVDHDGDLSNTRVAEAMTERVVTCAPDATLDSVMRDMTKGRFRHLPVVQRGALIGIISIGDVVKNRVDELEFEASSLREYVNGAA